MNPGLPGVAPRRRWRAVLFCGGLAGLVVLDAPAAPPAPVPPLLTSAVRFTDHGNGTITDSLTGLIWLKNADCLGVQTWSAALSSANNLASGSCGLTDGSTAGQWRLPNVNEWQSLVDYTRHDPVLPADHPFAGVQSSNFYWSSTTQASNTSNAWVVDPYFGVVPTYLKTDSVAVWPVRGGQ